MYYTHYVGYGSLEDLLVQAQTKKAQLQSDIFTLSSPATMGMEYRHTYAQVSFLDGQLAHIWRWKVATTLFTADGESFEPGQSKRLEAKIDSVWDSIWSYLDARDFFVIRSVVATPRDLLLMEGHRPKFLAFNQELGIYQMMQVSHA